MIPSTASKRWSATEPRYVLARGPRKKMARQKEKVVSSGPFPGQSSSYTASGDREVGVLGEGVAVRADTASPAFSKNGPGINT